MTWKRNILVLANVTAASDELLDALHARAGREQCAFKLIVPATHAGGGRARAEEKVQEAVSKLREAGLEADGSVCDPDPIIAITDAWDPKRFDEIVIATLPTALSKWLQTDLPHRVEKLTGAPVTHVVASPPKPPLEVVPPKPHEKANVLTPLTVLRWGEPHEAHEAHGGH
jgi:hypothetical protein